MGEETWLTNGHELEKSTADCSRAVRPLLACGAVIHFVENLVNWQVYIHCTVYVTNSPIQKHLQQLHTSTFYKNGSLRCAWLLSMCLHHAGIFTLICRSGYLSWMGRSASSERVCVCERGHKLKSFKQHDFISGSQPAFSFTANAGWHVSHPRNRPFANE